MSELLLVGFNNGIRAVMTETQYDWAHRSEGSDEEFYERRDSCSIITFAPRSRIQDWYAQGDPRFAGISGSVEDLDAILKRHSWREHYIYVPFSNGPEVAQNELLRHAASWETFRDVFGPDDWTFKFGRRPNWLMKPDAYQDHLLERTEHAITHGVLTG